MDYEEYIKNMNDFTKSALLETFNIGASRAADALSEMLGHPVTIEVPHLEIISLKTLPEKVGEDVKVAVYVGLGKEFSGHAFFIMDFDDATRLFDLMIMQEPGTTTEIDEIVKSAIMEMGNILISAYANALSEFLGLTIEQTPPEIAIDFLPAVLDFALADIGQYCDYTMLLGTVIKVEGVEFDEHFFILPKPEDMVKVLEKLTGGML
ncbi:chemotaxis protein CheC [Thermococcus peptonophilus]|uniref:Chemotaxis protein CheC n=1 Tax=Thermococcus peptonophilus TaxID=53952 RepID=A0A142CSQ6_9EURY|nr:chemotaxis protein CheC [Thermococcus peptonophilus]AMQ17808.1 chemotaxis protein CheC [Thermococcus peptonophilus]